jgi:hypothetical protein
MAVYQPIDKQVQFAFRGLDQQSMNKELAKFAKQELKKVIASGEASPIYETFVNDHRGPVDSVQAPGPVLFVFNNWPAIIQEAMQQLEKFAPRRTGRFARSFIVVVNGRTVQDWQAIPAISEVIITNFQPYVRKVESGALSPTTPAHVFDRAKSALSRKYSRGFSFTMRFMNLGSGVHPKIPYILKNHLLNAKGKTRKGRMAGDPISYPSIIIRSAVNDSPG